MINKSKDFTKEQILEMVDSCGELKYDYWYKNTLHYVNKDFVIMFVPDYRDCCESPTTLKSLLECEDYTSVTVLKGEDKPFEWEWYKKGEC